MTTALILGEIDTEVIIQDWVSQAARDDESQSRKESRFPFLNAATINRDGVETPVMCRDISKKGIGIIQAGCQPQIGPATLSVSLHQQPVYLDVDFTWRERRGSGWWTSGGSLNFASIDYAARLLLSLSNVVERRIHRRHPFCNPFAIYTNLELSDGCVGVENIADKYETLALSLDVSRGGMRLMCHQPVISHGRYVYLRRTNGDNTYSMFRARIVSQRELGNGYFTVGVKYAPERR